MCGGEGWKKISWTDRVEDAEVLHTVNEERNILQTMKNEG
jgi:hypothetical protein